jgi:hypothetical protein
MRPEGNMSPRLYQTASPILAPQRTALPWGFLPLQRLQAQAATSTGTSNPGCAAPSGFLNLLTRSSAHALLALSHARSAPGVEALRGFPLPVAATAFTARCPSSIFGDVDRRRSSGAAPKSDTSATPERTTPQRRSVKRHLDTAPNLSPVSLRGGRRASDPINDHHAQGFLHLGGPFAARWCYPTFAGRASLSLCGPLRGPLPSSLGSASCRASSHGLILSDGQVQR